MLQLITCSVSRGGAPMLQMKLALDSDWPADQCVLDHLQGGTSFEGDVANAMVRVLREGDIVVDIGANIGYLTVLASLLVGPTGRVIAFEPDPENVLRLRANVALNTGSNVTIVEKAVTDRSGEVEFFINSDNSGGNALWDPAQFPGNAKCVANPRPMRVAGTTLDDAWDELGLPTPRLIKIDTEGAEHQVLEGMRGLLTRQDPHFVIAEYHPFGLERMGSGEESLRGLVEGLGYSTFALNNAGGLPRFVPPATRIQVTAIINMLFSKPEWVGPCWPAVMLDSNDPG